MHRQDLQTNSENSERESFNQSSENIREEGSETNKRFPERLNKEHIKNFPIVYFKGKIHLIKEKKDLKKALTILQRESVLGFDTETRPSFKKGENYSVSLLQLSTSDEAFLFRLNHLGLPDDLVSLLADRDILKVGVAILDDVRALLKLKKFDAELFIKPRILAINKVDLIEKENLNKVINKFVKKVKYKGKAFNISALNGFGCKSLVFGLSELIERENDEK